MFPLLVQLREILVHAFIEGLVLNMLLALELSQEHRCKIFNDFVFEFLLQLLKVLREFLS